jgi:hypothetical protein
MKSKFFFLLCGLLILSLGAVRSAAAQPDPSAPLPPQNHAVSVETSSLKSSALSTNPAILNVSVVPTAAHAGDELTYSIQVTNPYPDSRTFTLSGDLAKILDYINGSETGGLAYTPATRQLSASTTLPGAVFNLQPNGLPTTYIAGSAIASLDLTSYCKGISPSPTCDETVFSVRGFNFTYMGVNYSTIKISSNGFITPGTTPLNPMPVNQHLPSPSLPNNIIAPLWSDLEFANANAKWLVWVTGNYTVIEWQNANLRGNPGALYSFEIWIQNGTNQITFAYGPMNADVSNPTTYGYTIGAENPDGTAGGSYYYYDAAAQTTAGSPPAQGTDLNLLNDFSFSSMSFAAIANPPDIHNALITQTLTVRDELTGWIVQASADTSIYVYQAFLPWVTIH